MASSPFLRAASKRSIVRFVWPHTPTVASLMWEISSGTPADFAISIASSNASNVFSASSRVCVM